MGGKIIICRVSFGSKENRVSLRNSPAVFVWNRLEKKKEAERKIRQFIFFFFFFFLATSEIEVSFDSGVTSIFVSNSVASSTTLLPRSCTQGSHPCLGHQGTWFPGINKFISWLAIVDDDEDEAEGGGPSAKPPSPPRTHQPPGWWSRLNDNYLAYVLSPVSLSKVAAKSSGRWITRGHSRHTLLTSCQEQRVFLNPGCDRFWVSSSRRDLSGYLNPAAILEFSYFLYFNRCHSRLRRDDSR